MIEATGSGNNHAADYHGEQSIDLTEAIGYVSNEIAAALALSGLGDRVAGKLQVIGETRAAAADLSLTEPEYRTLVDYVMDGSAVPDLSKEVFSSLFGKISERADELLRSGKPELKLSGLERAVLKNRYTGGHVLSRGQLAQNWNELFGDNLDNGDMRTAEIGLIKKLSTPQGAAIDSQTTPAQPSTHASRGDLTPKDTLDLPPKPDTEDGIAPEGSSDNETVNEFSPRQMLAARILEIDPVDIEHVDETALDEFLSKLYELYQTSAAQQRHQTARERQTALLSSVYSRTTQGMEELAAKFGYNSINSVQTTIYNTIKQLRSLVDQNPDISEQLLAEDLVSNPAAVVRQEAPEADTEKEAGTQTGAEEDTQQEIIRQAIIEAVDKINKAKGFDTEIADNILLVFANGLTVDRNDAELMAALKTLNSPIQLLSRGVRVNEHELRFTKSQKLFIKARCGMFDRVKGSYKMIAEFLNTRSGETYSLEELRELEATSLGLIAEVVSEFSTNGIKKKTYLS